MFHSEAYIKLTYCKVVTCSTFNIPSDKAVLSEGMLKVLQVTTLTFPLTKLSCHTLHTNTLHIAHIKMGAHRGQESFKQIAVKRNMVNILHKTPNDSKAQIY
jgi:hypothetical protein